MIIEKIEKDKKAYLHIMNILKRIIKKNKTPIIKQGSTDLVVYADDRGSFCKMLRDRVRGEGLNKFVKIYEFHKGYNEALVSIDLERKEKREESGGVSDFAYDPLCWGFG